MNSARWKRVKAIFLEALERADEERDAFLEQRCDEAALREEVSSLLAAHEQAAALDLYEEGALADMTNAPEVPESSSLELSLDGKRVGPYRLVRKLGHGGMGVVYLAERADGQFEKQVAIKLIPPAAAGAGLLGRLRRERQILASLEHPNIARFLDGGVTEPAPATQDEVVGERSAEEGVPYIVMEYVDGEPIDRYCDTHQLSLSERLALFRTVCAAVHYAHQNLVVHRDLKPSNILVTDAGTVKLLDFGIARLLSESGAADASTLTRLGMRVLTPEYAAPEQVRSTSVTTASDVYTLGVVLYELLTGRRPYQTRGLSPSEMERVICEVEPTRPSTIVTQVAPPPDAEGHHEGATTRAATPEDAGRARDTQAATLRRRLTGDLDNIVMMALRKEPERRYSSAEQLSEDVRRHLEGLPVTAHRDTLGYRTSKFIRRHRMGVAAAVLVFLSLVAGIAGTAWQAHRTDVAREKAERRFADVRHLANAFLFEFHDAIADLPGSTEARELVVKRALEYLDKLAEEAEGDRSLQLELAQAYVKVGNVQGNPTNANLGQTQAALESYRKAMTITQALLNADSTDIEARQTLASLYGRLGDVQATRGDLEKAEESKRRAVARYEALAEEQPADTSRQIAYAVGRIKLGDLMGNPDFPNRGAPSEALANYLDALRTLEEIGTARPRTYRLIGLTLERIGTIYGAKGDIQAALEAYRQSLDIRKAYVAEHPVNTDAIRDLGVAHEKMGNVYSEMGDLKRALASYRTALGAFERLAQADPMNVQARQTLAISHLKLGNLTGNPTFPNLGNREEAAAHYRKALAIMQTLRGVDSTNAHTKYLLDLVRQRLREVGALAADRL